MKKLILGLLLLTACGTPQTGQSGATGESGQNGSAGPQGPSGTPGSGLTIDRVVYCSKLDNGVGPTLFLQYQIVTYSTGDKFLNCSITDASAEYTNTIIYKANQVGASLNNCKVTYDVQNSNAGYWTFSTLTDGTGINSRYLDSNSSYSGHTLYFTNNDCVVTQ